MHEREVHTYDFRFVSGINGQPPELTIALSTHNVNELNVRLNAYVRGMLEHARSCLGPQSALFALPAPDFLGCKNRFGYNDCGYVTCDEQNTLLHLPLATGRKLHQTVLSLHVLFMVLGVAFEDTPQKSNRVQKATIDTRVDHTRHDWGYMVSGWVNAAVIQWSRGYALKELGAGYSNHRTQAVPLPFPIIEAMRETWTSVARPSLKRWTRDYSGQLTTDGRFHFKCFGDACDLSIYPDQLYDGAEFSQFGCHNLDTPEQQITLLAGLAKLLELSEEGN